MMRSPKYRKGKKPAYSAPVAAMFILAAVLGMQYGCTDSATGPTVPEQTGIEKDVYGAISGDVHDLYINASLRNVKVTMQGVKKQYTTRTDADGKFRINNVWLGSVTGLTGGAGDAGGWGDGSQPQKVEFDFPLYFEVSGYAPWKEQVALSYEYIVDNGTIVIPSGTFFEVGRTGMMPYVQNFSGTVYAGPGRTPARGVTVMLDHTDYPSSTSDWPDCNGNCPDCDDNNCDSYDDYVKLVNSFAITDDNGVFSFDLDDRVVAYDDYDFIVTPYDIPDQEFPAGCVVSCDESEDPDCVECECFSCVGDGIYEYDSMHRELYLEPQPDSGYDLMGYELDGNGNPVVVQTHEFAVNLQTRLEQPRGDLLLPVEHGWRHHSSRLQRLRHQCDLQLSSQRVCVPAPEGSEHSRCDQGGADLFCHDLLRHHAPRAVERQRQHLAFPDLRGRGLHGEYGLQLR